MIDLNRIREAHVVLAGRVHRTPLFSARLLGELTGTHFFIKPECLQKTGSFKVRGVFNRVSHLSAEEKARGLISVSAGNHAQALAWVAAQEQVRCTVVMPEHASATKVTATREYGATVVQHRSGREMFEKMEELQRQHGYTLIHPYDDEEIMAGHGTAGLEIVSDLPEVDAVIVPVGGGGLISGVATAVKQLSPDTKVYGVEPEGAQTVRAALEAGRIVTLENMNTIADGLAAPFTTDRVLEHVRAYVDDMIVVSDADIADALTVLLSRTKLLVEPAGAAAAAAILSGTLRLPTGANVAVLASGGNIDLHRLKELLP
jgi:threonine dehydratase